MSEVPTASDDASRPPAPPRPLWRRGALRVRTAIAFGLSALLLSGVLSAATYTLVRSSLLHEREGVAERQAFTNARLLRSRLDPVPPDMSQLLAGLQVGPGGGSLVYMQDRWFSSSVELTSGELPESLVDTVGEGDAATQRSEMADQPTLIVGIPISSLDAQYYETTSLADVERTLSTLSRSLFIAAVLATAAGALLGLALSSTVLHPLRRFALVAQRISGGEVGTRLDAEGDADLEPLADSFNEMLDELDDRIEREKRFASDVSHEVRGPVAALAAAVSVVDRRRDQLPPEVVPAIDALNDQVQAFNQLVLDLLEIARFDARTSALDTSSQDLVALSHAVLDERHHDGVALHSEPDGPIAADVDRRRLAQVLANLLDNAQAYAGGATSISVIDAGNGTVRLCVDDAGPGVPKEERDEIFARFARGSTADAVGSPNGTGLGLALSTQHVALHGGRLWVDTNDAGGARFVIELPKEHA